MDLSHSTEELYMDDSFYFVTPSALVVMIMFRRLCVLVRCRGSIYLCLSY